MEDIEARLVPLEWLKIGSNRRAVDEAAVDRLAESIESVGLLQSIGAREDGTLIWGRHRYRSFQKLGRTHIPCKVCNLDEITAELAEIDENIMHHQLSPIEATKQMVRRKELYEAKHPETKTGANKPVEVRWNKGFHSENPYSRAPSFVEDTAAKTGKGVGTIARNVRIGQAFTADELHKLKDAKVTVLILDKLVAAKRKDAESVAEVLRQPVQLMRQAAEELVGGTSIKRHEMKKKEPTQTTRRETKAREAQMAANAKAWIGSGPSISVAYACHTDRYSRLGGNEKRQVVISGEPNTAALVLADHFDRNGMQELLRALVPYLPPEIISYLLRLITEAKPNVGTALGLYQYA